MNKFNNGLKNKIYCQPKMSKERNNEIMHSVSQ